MNHGTINATISFINLQLPPAQPRTDSFFTDGHQQTKAFIDDGIAGDDGPSFPDAFGDATQNLSDDDLGEEATLPELSGNGASKQWETNISIPG